MINIKPNFKKATHDATELLFDQDASHCFSRILCVKDLIYRNKNIIFCSIQEYCEITEMPLSSFINEKASSIKDGCCLIDKNRNINIVLYNAFDKNMERRNWSIAHEVGHIYLGHTEDGMKEEIEAHYFASQLFMPEYTLFMMEKTYGVFTAFDLMEIFGVSHQAATKRLHSYQKMTVINDGYKDKAIWKQQKEKIDLYFYCKKSGEDFRYTLNAQNILHEATNSIMH